MFSRCLLTLAIFSLWIIAGCTQQQHSETSNQSDQKNSSIVFAVNSVNTRPDLVPNFSWKDSSGKNIDFDSYRGKVTLINFWATWCGPCKHELPDLVQISKDFSDKNVKLLGISTDRGADAADAVASFVREHGIPYQNLISNEQLEEAFGNIPAIPTSFLINSDGKIVQTFVGGRSKEFFSEAITALLK